MEKATLDVPQPMGRREQRDGGSEMPAARSRTGGAGGDDKRSRRCWSWVDAGKTTHGTPKGTPLHSCSKLGGQTAEKFSEIAGELSDSVYSRGTRAGGLATDDCEESSLRVSRWWMNMALKEMGARGFTAWCWARGFVPWGRTERKGACYCML